MKNRRRRATVRRKFFGACHWPGQRIDRDSMAGWEGRAGVPGYIGTIRQARRPAESQSESTPSARFRTTFSSRARGRGGKMRLHRFAYPLFCRRHRNTFRSTDNFSRTKNSHNSRHGNRSKRRSHCRGGNHRAADCFARHGSSRDRARLTALLRSRSHLANIGSASGTQLSRQWIRSSLSLPAKCVHGTCDCSLKKCPQAWW